MWFIPRYSGWCGVSVDISTGPFCTSLGCDDDADAVIRLDDGRTRPVCDDHTEDGEVVGDV